MKFKKSKWINLRVNPKEHDILTEAARKEGRTVAGMIRYALRKVFGLDL